MRPCIPLSLVVIVYALSTPSLMAQLSQPQRYEVEHKANDEYYNLVSLREEGIALFQETSKYEKSNKVWKLVILDTALQEKSNQTVEIDARSHLIGHDYWKGSVSYLFRRDNYEKGDLTLVTCNLTSYEVKQYTIKPEIALRLTHFNQAESTFIFGGYVGTEPALLVYDPATEGLAIVPGFFQKDCELIDVRVNENGTFNVALIDRSNREDRKLTFRVFENKGKLLLEDIVSIDPMRTLQTGTFSALQRDDILLLGTWGQKNTRQSTGFYSIRLDPFNEQPINYFTLGDFNHYFDYLRPKRAKRRIAKIKADVAAGRIPNQSDYIMPYRIMEYQHGFVLLADVYNPSNNVNRSPYYSPYMGYPGGYYDPYWGGGYNSYGRMYGTRPYYTSYGNNVNNNEDALRIYETTLVAFDEKGQVKWDESLKLDDLKRPAPEQITDFTIWKNKLYFLYKKESELKAKIISLDSTDKQELTEKVTLSGAADEIRYEERIEGSVRHWHANAFYIWGYQGLRDKTKRDNRTVFYINKITVQ